MVVFCIPLHSLHLALICFTQKFAKRGDCWVFLLAGLLLKQISLSVLLEPMFKHVFTHLCKMLDTIFQHPGTIQCAWVHAYLYARLIFKRKQYFLILLTKQRAYLYRISCGIFLKLWLYFRKYLKLFWTLLKMFILFRTFHICLWFLFCRSAKRSVLFWSPTKVVDLSCFSI